MPTLYITGDDGVQRVAALPDRTLRIGRSADNDVVLPDADKGVSRSHAELRLEQGQYFIVDLQSQNGTWLNGQRVERAAVPANAEIAIGLYRLKLQSAPATSVGDIPLYRPEHAMAAGGAVAAGGTVHAPIAARSSGHGKWALFGGGIAIGMIVIVAGRMMLAPSSASTPAATPAPQTQPAPAPAPTPVATTSAAGETGQPPTASDSAAPVSADAAAQAATPPPAAEESERPARPAVSSAARTAAREAFDAARKLDAAGDWLGALRKYDDVQQIDATYPGLDRSVKQVWAKLRTAGADALKRARQYDAIGLSTDALREYDKAAQWLPPDDPNRQIARGRADQLRNGAK